MSKYYCCEDISLIENYDKAVADKTVHGYIFSYEPPKLRSIADISPLF